MTSDNSTPDWEQYASWDKHYVWHAFTQMRDYKPLIIESADGCILKDIEGNELIDGVSSVWCNVHGHCHQKAFAVMGSVETNLDLARGGMLVVVSEVFEQKGGPRQALRVPPRVAEVHR